MGGINHMHTFNDDFNSVHHMAEQRLQGEEEKKENHVPVGQEEREFFRAVDFVNAIGGSQREKLALLRTLLTNRKRAVDWSGLGDAWNT
jgi:hypothetical protein